VKTREEEEDRSTEEVTSREEATSWAKVTSREEDTPRKDDIASGTASEWVRYLQRRGDETEWWGEKMEVRGGDVDQINVKVASVGVAPTELEQQKRKAAISESPRWSSTGTGSGIRI